MKNLLRAVAVCLVGLCLWRLNPVKGQAISDFIEAEVDHAAAYIGEPILYTWHWYIAGVNGGQANPSAQTQYPNFGGFGQELLESTTAPAIRDGQAYQVITQQIVLYPRQEGPYVIDPLRIVVPETPFAPAMSLESDKIEITIRPVPDNAPATFVDAVGQFDLEGHFDQQVAQTGAPLVFTMTIRGSGNAPILSQPTLTLGPEWRAYARGSRLRRDGALLGERMFTWQIVALQPGTLTFPSQSWSSLNPQTGQYETRATEPFAVTVTGDPIAEPQVVAEPTLYPLQFGGLWREARARDMLSPAPPSTSEAVGYGVMATIVCVLIPAFAGVGVWAWGSLAHRPLAPEKSQKKKPSSIYQSRLVAVGQKSPHEIANEVDAVLQDYLKQKRGITLTPDNREAALQVVPSALRTRLMACFDEAQTARYAPFTAEDAANLIQKARRLIQTMEDTWPAA